MLRVLSREGLAYISTGDAERNPSGRARNSCKHRLNHAWHAELSLAGESSAKKGTSWSDNLRRND